MESNPSRYRRNDGVIMVESLHDLMIIKKEIEGMEVEIKEIKDKTGLDRKIAKLELLKKLYQAELKECVRHGVQREGTFRIVNTGRVVRKVNVEKIMNDPTLREILSSKLSISVKDAREAFEVNNMSDDAFEEMCDRVSQDKYDVIDMEG